MIFKEFYASMWWVNVLANTQIQKIAKCCCKFALRQTLKHSNRAIKNWSEAVEIIFDQSGHYWRANNLLTNLL